MAEDTCETTSSPPLDERSVHFAGLVVTYNDARWLRECLSRLSFCDELIVVDLGSTDQSVRIAEEFSATVYLHRKVPVVEEVREFAVAKASHDWIVFLDPDLILPWRLQGEIRKLILASPDAGIIGVPYQNYFIGKPLRYGRWGGIRIYPAVMHRGRVDLKPTVHRGIRVRAGFSSLQVARTPERTIVHHWADSLEHFLAKQSRYYHQEALLAHNDGIRFAWRSAIVQSLKGVFRSLIRQQGYRDGRLGIFLSLFWGWYLFNCAMALRHLEATLCEE